MELEKLRKLHPQHWEKANAIRVLTLDAVAAANSGHSGMPVGMADVATILFEKHLKFSTAQPNWPDRDRFILSAGHGSMLLYSVAYLCGYADFDIDQLKNFRQLGKKTAGHPENFLSDVIETTTGPLGQGIANSVGFAIAEESLRARFGRNIIDHHTFVIAGDGCLMEGISHEAMSLAGHLKLKNLVMLFDNNNISIIMGCYGIGISRIVAAAIEQNNDEKGIIWPKTIAPFDINLITIGADKDSNIEKTSKKIYHELREKGFEVIFDDRDDGFGKKIKDAELVGIPTTVIFGKNFSQNDEVEIIFRNGEKISASLSKLQELI